MSVLVVTGTGTGVGKTVVTAAIAALALRRGRRVAVLKPAQTGVHPGEPADVDEVIRLAGPAVTARELRRYPDPLAPETAARRAGAPYVTPPEIAAAVTGLASAHDLVLVEGAGGLLVRFDSDGGTLADVAWSLGAPVLVVTGAGLGTLNATALTTEVLRGRGIECRGLVIGRWPRRPDLAAAHNLVDLPVVAGVPLLGVVPDGIVDTPDRFVASARTSLSSWLGGDADAGGFVVECSA